MKFSERILVALFVLVVALLVFVATTLHFGNVPLYNASTYEDPGDLAWCDSIYHRNVGCPGYGKVKVPQEVLKREGRELVAWCDKTYHRNVSCPKFGQVKVPKEVLIREEAEHLAWCDKINHLNVGCPKYKG